MAEQQPEPLGFDTMAVVAAAPAMRRTDDDGAVIIGPMPEQLPAEMQRHLPGGRLGYDFMSAFGALWGSVSALFNRIGPLQAVADEMPHIVAHSDQVHTELRDGLDAIRTAVAAVQTAAGSLGTSLTPIAQLAAQAQAHATIASAAATAAGQRCAALEARMATQEARTPRTWRAAGNLPTLALNGTSSVSCPWASPVPSPLPAVEQCQVFVAGSATPTVTAVSSTAVTVSLKAAAALLPAPGAVQVIAVTW